MSSVGVHCVVCGQLCFSSTRKAISVECKMTIIHHPSKCTNVMSSMRTGCGWMLIRMRT